MDSKPSIEEIGTKEAPLSWEEFEEYIKKDVQEQITNFHSPWRYRGQANENWELLTTLERFFINKLGKKRNTIPIEEYYSYIEPLVDEINSLLKQDFIFDKSDFEFLNQKVPIFNLPNFDLMCYLRHHGFPSPMLDWSSSYLIAAFFAFRENHNCNVSIWAYKEWEGKPRSIEPIFLQEFYLHKNHNHRHLAQKSIYTIPIYYNPKTNQNVFVKHSIAIRACTENPRIKKFNISLKEQKKVLDILNKHNINDYTLFGDEESLMRTLTYKVFREI